MKKQLLLNFTQSLFRKLPFRIAAFAVLTILTAQTSFAQQWNILSNETAVSSVSTSYTNIAVVPDGGDFTPYVIYVETLYAGASSSGYPATGLAKVKKRQADGTWIQVGGNLTTTGASYTRIYADASGNLYVTYIDGAVSSKLAVRKYNSVSGNWEPLNNDTNNLYASSVSATHGLKNFFTTPRSSMAFDSNGTPYIAFCSVTGTNFSPIVKKFDGTSWVNVGTGASVSTDIALSPSLTIDDANKPWLAYTAASNFVAGTTSVGILALYTCSDTSTSGTWTPITIPATIPVSTAIGSTTSMRDLSITFVKGTGNTLSGQIAIVHYNTANSSKGTVISFDRNSTWSSLGTVSTSGCPNLNITSDYLGSLYCSFVDNYNASYLARSRVFKLEANTTITPPWSELTDQSAPVNGIDEPTGSVSLALGYNSSLPYIVYTKKNSSYIDTPILRKYNSLAPAISAFTPKPPVADQAFTITGTNFTNVSAVTIGGTDVASYTVVSPTSITGTIGSTVSNLSVIVTTANGIAVATIPSPLTYTSVPSNYNGSPIYPTITTSNLYYTITPTLPTGLSINNGNGIISGTVTTAKVSTLYTVTATNKFGNVTTTMTFTAGLPPSALSYGTIPSSYTTNTAITSLTPVITQGTGATYTVSPSLPAGLSLDSATGVISGTPTSVSASTAYTVTASTTYGSTTKAITFATGVAPSAFSYTPVESASYTAGTIITPLVAVITSGDGTPVYTVNPALPAGLVLSSSTGEISGTPTAVTVSTAYTVTATTIYGSTTKVITFSVDASLSTDSFEKNDTVKAYPNPTTDTVTVSLPNNAAIEKIAVYNSLGQLMSVETKNTVSLQNLASGNYYLTIYTADGNYAKKIIKQ